MKKIALLSLSILLLACGGEEKSDEEKDGATREEAVPSSCGEEAACGDESSCGEGCGDGASCGEDEVLLMDDDYEDVSEQELLGEEEFSTTVTSAMTYNQAKASLNRNGCADVLKQKRKAKLKLGKVTFKIKKGTPVSIDGFGLELDDVPNLNLFLLAANRALHDGCVEKHSLLKMIYLDGVMDNNELSAYNTEQENLKELRTTYLEIINSLEQADSKEDVKKIDEKAKEKLENTPELAQNV